MILHSEPRPPTGAMGATGALNALGRPDLDFWTLYVRECLQNSWDARDASRATPVAVRFCVRRLTPTQRRFLATHAFDEMPRDRSEGWNLLLDPTVMTITDTGTTGMGGPTRADIDDPSVHDFADFVWNVGQPPDNDLGGGTYGYGKSVHYLASRCRAIVVHTRCRTDDGLETRLIVSAWGPEFVADINRRAVAHTGRHWWGAATPDPELPIAPVTGGKADDLARAIGLPALGEGGTSIMVLAAAVDDPAAWGVTVADAVAWHCWPKLIDLGAGPDMTVRVAVDDADVPVPDPDSHPELSQLTRCLRESLGVGAQPADRIPIELAKPAVQTGWLALRKHMERPRDTASRPFDGPMRHIALMRAPRLVVKYLRGPEPPAPFAAWCGVFVARDEYDRAFALAEPPAHDDWVPRAVEDKQTRRIVNVSIGRIRDSARAFTAPPAVPSDGDGRGLGMLADQLGDLLPVGGRGAVENPRPVSRSTRSRTTSATVLSHHLESEDGALFLAAEVEVELAESVDRAELSLKVDVASSDGAGVEREPPAGATVPELLGWFDPSGAWKAAESVSVTQQTRGTWFARIAVPRDAAVVVRPRCQERTDA